LQKNGQEVGQTVPHVHFHYIPRMKGDDSTITFLFRMFFINWLGPVSQEELDEKIFILKRAMEEQDSLDASA
jgi:diadenosine tetraphosphate (Ap4A) HIT family hydrolase